MYSRTDYDGMTPDQLHGRIANLWSAVLDVPRNGRDVFQIVVAELARLRDTLDRITTEAPSAIPACNCGEGEGCPRCEIRHLLDIYNGRVPGGPYRKPQQTLSEFMEANGLGPEDMGTKSDWLPGGVYM